MDGKTRGTRRFKAGSAGFSLIEIMAVLLIIAVMVGVTGSLMASMVTLYEFTDDSGIARRRAQDVFNILRQPVLGAATGIPPARLDSYFSVGGVPAPVAGWGRAVEVVDNRSFSGRGNALRIIYSLKSGGRNGDSEMADFSAPKSGSGSGYAQRFIDVPRRMSLVAPGESVTGVTIPLKGEHGIVEGGWPLSGDIDMRSYITFPGTNNPLFVTEYRDDSNPELRLVGMTPHAASGVMLRNFIYPYHELLLVRAAVAYVDDNSVFCFADVTDRDYPPDALPRARDLDSGFRITGIKAVDFEMIEGGRALRVTLVAEGDNALANRRNSAETDALRAGWAGVAFDEETYYEESSFSFRTRNIEFE